MSEDRQYVIPTNPSIGTVDILELKKERENAEVRSNVRKLRKLLLKINRGIFSVQKTSYQHLITKRRYREQTKRMNDIKEERRRTVEEARKKRAELVAVPEMTIEDVMKEMNRGQEENELDEFDLR